MEKWAKESMEEVVKCVKEENRLHREAARHYYVPLGTLRHRVIGVVEMECKSGPLTVLSSEEQSLLVTYVLLMVENGLGLSREDVMTNGISNGGEDGEEASF